MEQTIDDSFQDIQDEFYDEFYDELYDGFLLILAGHCGSCKLSSVDVYILNTHHQLDWSKELMIPAKIS